MYGYFIEIVLIFPFKMVFLFTILNILTIGHNCKGEKKSKFDNNILFTFDQNIFIDSEQIFPQFTVCVVLSQDRYIIGDSIYEWQ